MSLQRCEGDSLEEVLAQVRARWGDDAAIVEANKLRKGGVAGFFARERFEVVVDDGEDEGDDAPASTAAAVTARPSPGPALADHLLDLADSVSDAERHEAAPAHQPSTEQSDFARVLESLSRQLREQDDAPAAPAPAFEPWPAPAPAQEPAPVAPEPEPVLAPAPPPVEVEGPVLFYPRPAAVLPPPVVAAEVLPMEALLRVGLPEELARPAGPAADQDPARWLASLLEYVPQAPRLPTGRGAVVAVVGDRQAALELGRDLAGSMEIDPETLILASPGYKGRAIPEHLRIDSVELAAEQRRSWRRRGNPTVVSIEAPVGRQPGWARLVLDALEPTMVWAAVEAHRKPEDIHDWACHLGGVDALSVTGVEETVSPAAVLRCGIPVGLLEGRPATPALWAALLTPRLVNPCPEP